MESISIQAADHALVILALEKMASEAKRKRWKVAARLGRWTDQQEASNPGFRDFLTGAMARYDATSARCRAIAAALENISVVEATHTPATGAMLSSNRNKGIRWCAEHERGEYIDTSLDEEPSA
jgi:hypothetical protein